LHSKDLVNTSTSIRNDLHITQDLKAKVDQAVEDTIVTTRIIDGFRNHQSGNTYLKDHAGFPLEYVFPLVGSAFTHVKLSRYFSRVSDQMKQRLDWYKSTIEVSNDHGDSFQLNFATQQIERKLASAASSTQTPQSMLPPSFSISDLSQCEWYIRRLSHNASTVCYFYRACKQDCRS
jgi:nucleoporin p58/p45